VPVHWSLKEKNYATACIGKWHLGHLPQHLPPNHGFDYYFGIPYSNDMDAGLNDWEGATDFPATPLIENLEIIEMGTDQTILTRRYTEKAVQFIQKNKDQPFFLYFPHTFPHIPLFASDRFLGKSSRGLYGDVVEEIDWSVGEIMKALRDNQLDKNTLVFFTSDNGPWLSQSEEGGSAGLLRDGKGSTWEGGVREPAIAWWPGVVASGSTTQALSSTMDLLPTCLKLAGIELPQDRVLDGIDLMPVFNESTQRIREYLYYYQFTKPYAIRKGPWKAHFTTHTSYVGQEPVDHEPPLLFNLDIDPSEKYDIAESHPEIVNELIAEANRHRESIRMAPTQLESVIVN